MSDDNLTAADAALTTAPSEVKAAETVSAAAVTADAEAIIREVRAALIPGSPISQDAASLAHLDLVFIPALIAALKKG